MRTTRMLIDRNRFPYLTVTYHKSLLSPSPSPSYYSSFFPLSFLPTPLPQFLLKDTRTIPCHPRITAPCTKKRNAHFEHDFIRASHTAAAARAAAAAGTVIACALPIARTFPIMRARQALRGRLVHHQPLCHGLQRRRPGLRDARSQAFQNHQRGVAASGRRQPVVRRQVPRQIVYMQ